MEPDIVWQAILTKDLVAHLTDEQLERLIKELDDVVYYALMSFMYEITVEN